MRKRAIKGIVSVSILAFAVMFGGCSKSETKDTNAQATESVQENKTEPTKSASDSETNADSVTQTVTETVPEKADIDKIAADSVFNVTWYTTEGDYSAGTSFLLDSKTHDQKLLVTAFHYLWPDNVDTFTGPELPNYVLAGEIFNARTDESTGATLKNCLVMEDADAVPQVNKDVAAFSVQDADNLATLPISEHEVKEGDTVYLLADLWDTDDIHENCVYEGTVLREDDGVLYYQLDEKYGTTGASGAPIVNEYGEVVGIHIGSNGSMRFAHSAASFLDQIDRGTLSSINYPSDLTSLKPDTTEGGTAQSGELLTFSREDVLNTMFFQLGINKVTVTNQIGDYTADEGSKFVVLNVTLDANADVASSVDMYYDDFWAEWGDGDNYANSYPLENGFSDTQLPEEYLIYAGTPTTGDLLFMIPEEYESMDLMYMDYYTSANSDEVNYGDTFLMTIPVEDWTK